MRDRDFTLQARSGQNADRDQMRGPLPAGMLANQIVTEPHLSTLRHIQIDVGMGLLWGLVVIDQ
jgi:hypothetical protein